MVHAAQPAETAVTDLAPQAWITRLPTPVQTATTGPLSGLRFAVKDNIDVQGMPTTAACPGFAFTPTAHAKVVQPLLDAGACLVGKTNLDQFACGLNGTRSPYGAVPNAFNPDYSGHYLVYHDGTPFYGLGHGDALNILIDGFNIDRGVGLFNNMVEANENYVVYWPLYSNSPLQNSYDDYMTSSMDLIDVVVKDLILDAFLLLLWNPVCDIPLRPRGHN